MDLPPLPICSSGNQAIVKKKRKFSVAPGEVRRGILIVSKAPYSESSTLPGQSLQLTLESVVDSSQAEYKCFVLFCFSSLKCKIWSPSGVFIYISQIINEVEHRFMCLLTILIRSLEIRLFRVLTHF